MRVLLAAFLALAPGVASAEAGDMARARKIISGSCFLCHGAQGESTTELYPRLAAQNAAYLAKQLENFKSGARKSGTMRPMVEKLAPRDMEALGLYFSRQRSEPHAPTDPAAAARGREIYEKGGADPAVAACAGCHGANGHGSERLPRLAGQVAPYLAAQLRNFGERVRTNDNAVMQSVAAKMTAAEIDAVAQYLSALE